MLKQVLLAATALSLVVGATNLTQAADTPEDAQRVANELNGVIANIDPATGNKRAIVIEPNAGAGNNTVPGAETSIVPGAETPVPGGPTVATAPVVDLVPNVIPTPNVIPAPNADAGKPQILTSPAPNANNAPAAAPGIVANAPGQPALNPINDGADLYRRLTAQGYRPLQLLESNGKVFSVLVADVYRSDVTYVLAVDTTYGKILSIRPVSAANYGYGNNYGGYTAPAPNYANPYGNGYAPPANNYGYTAPAQTYTAPTYTAPNYAAPTYTAPTYTAPGYGRY